PQGAAAHLKGRRLPACRQTDDGALRLSSPGTPLRHHPGACPMPEDDEGTPALDIRCASTALKRKGCPEGSLRVVPEEPAPYALPSSFFSAFFFGAAFFLGSALLPAVAFLVLAAFFSLAGRAWGASSSSSAISSSRVTFLSSTETSPSRWSTTFSSNSGARILASACGLSR